MIVRSRETVQASHFRPARILTLYQDDSRNNNVTLVVVFGNMVDRSGGDDVAFVDVNFGFRNFPTDSNGVNIVGQPSR